MPAFDAYAYVAMAERPSVFTVAPWGYRLLTPALVAALPFRHVERRFQVVTEGALLLAATGVFLFLRRLGYADLPACVGSLAFALSGPVGEAVRYRYLAEPVTVLLEILLLGAAVAGAGTPVLALVLLLGTWSKEFFLLFAPVVLLGRARHVGWRRGLLDMLLAAVPALAAPILLRAWWTPHVASPYAGLGTETLWLAVERLRTSWPLWLGAVPLYGLMPLALLGALRASGRRLAPLSLYVGAVALVPPFLNPVAFFPADIPRLLIYALPALIPLALAALEGIWAPPVPAAVLPSRRPRRAAAAWAAVVLTALLPMLLVDGYRRLDLSGPRDGPYVLALCRESWRAARRLERGEAVVLDPAGFTWDPAFREELGRMRWFLREGWGEHAHYGTGDVVMKAPRASILLPILTPREVGVKVDLVPGPAALAVEVNGQPAALWRGAGGGVRIPADLLFRGDNVVTLVALDGMPGARLRGLVYEP